MKEIINFINLLEALCIALISLRIEPINPKELTITSWSKLF